MYPARPPARHAHQPANKFIRIPRSYRNVWYEFKVCIQALQRVFSRAPRTARTPAHTRTVPHTRQMSLRGGARQRFGRRAVRPAAATPPSRCLWAARDGCHRRWLRPRAARFVGGEAPPWPRVNWPPSPPARGPPSPPASRATCATLVREGEASPPSAALNAYGRPEGRKEWARAVCSAAPGERGRERQIGNR